MPLAGAPILLQLSFPLFGVGLAAPPFAFSASMSDMGIHHQLRVKGVHYCPKCFDRPRTFLPRTKNPITASTSQDILPITSTLGHVEMVKYGMAMQAKVAPTAAENPWISCHAGREDQWVNNVNAIPAHTTPAIITSQDGCTGCGTKIWAMTSNHAAPITNAIKPAAQAGIVVRE